MFNHLQVNKMSCEATQSAQETWSDQNNEF